MSKRLKGTTVLGGISQAIESKDGKALSKHLRCFSGENSLEALRGFKVPSSSIVRTKVWSRWVEVVECSFRVKSFVGSRARIPDSSKSYDNHWKIIRLSAEDWIELFDLQISLVQYACQSERGILPWSLPALYALNSDLRRISIIADEIKASRGEKRTYLEEAARRTNKAFTLCVTDRSPNIESSRKWGTYMITAMLFRIYFKLSKTSLCSMILRSISVAQIPPLEEFPISEQIAFKYYDGVLKFYEDSYLKADSNLGFVLKHIVEPDIQASPLIRERVDKNKRLVLNYIIPVRMAIGVLPTQVLFRDYSSLRDLYEGFASSIVSGNVRAYDTLLAKLQTLLIKKGTYFAIESSRVLALRTLFKKVWISNGKTHRILLSDFFKAFDLLQLNLSNDEIMCFIANVIDKGLLKGYISFEKQIIVTAKGSPFPSIKSICGCELT